MGTARALPEIQSEPGAQALVVLERHTRRLAHSIMQHACSDRRARAWVVRADWVIPHEQRVPNPLCSFTSGTPPAILGRGGGSAAFLIAPGLQWHCKAALVRDFFHPRTVLIEGSPWCPAWVPAAFGHRVFTCQIAGPVRSVLAAPCQPAAWELHVIAVRRDRCACQCLPPTG
jgi:hypothetical protein